MFRLLVVEDEHTARAALRETFDWAAWGFTEIRDAANGREALDVCAGFRPDLVITDIRMPGMSGLELADVLLHRLPSCRLIIISAYQNPDYVHRAFRSRAVDYLLKPVKQEMLLEAVMRAVEQLLEDPADGERTGPAEGSFRSGLHGIRERILRRILACGPRAADLAGAYGNLFLGQSRTGGNGPVGLRYGLYLIRRAEPSSSGPEADFDELENLLQVHGESSGDTDGGFLMPVRTGPREIACVVGVPWPPDGSGAVCDRVSVNVDRAIRESWGDRAEILHAGWTDRLLDLGERYARISAPVTAGPGAVSGAVSGVVPVEKPLTVHEKSLALRIRRAVDDGFIDECLSVKKIASALDRTSAYLCMVFKKAYGMTINDYVNLVRVAEAKRLLDGSFLKLYDVAYEVGYASENYFSKVFRKYDGRSPSEYRERIR